MKLSRAFVFFLGSLTLLGLLPFAISATPRDDVDTEIYKQRKEAELQEEMARGVEKVALASGMASPHTAAAIATATAIKQILHQTSSKTLEEFSNGEGKYAYLRADATRRQITVLREDLGALVSQDLASTFFSVWPQEYRTFIEEYISTLKLQPGNQDSEEARFTMTYSNENGEVFLIGLAFKFFLDESLGKQVVTVGRVALRTHFKLAPRVLLVTKSRSNWLSSSTSQELVYINRDVSPQDISSLVFMVLDMFARMAEALKFR